MWYIHRCPSEEHRECRERAKLSYDVRQPEDDLYEVSCAVFGEAPEANFLVAEPERASQSQAAQDQGHRLSTVTR